MPVPAEKPSPPAACLPAPQATPRDASGGDRSRRPVFGLTRSDWVAAATVVLACTLVSELLLPYLALAGSATIYLAGVVYVALRKGQAASMLAVVMSIAMFDLLVVEPRWSLTPIDPQHYFTFVVMAVVGWLVGRLAEQARQQAQVAEARARRAQALNELAAKLLAAQTPAEVGAGLADAVAATFGIEAELRWPSAHGAAVDDATSMLDREGAGVGAHDRHTHDRHTQDGRTREDDRLLLPLQGAGAASAVLAVRWPADRTVSPEERQLLDAFVNQSALAMQRAWFEQRSAAAAVEAETERLRNTLLSGISHDFRTPLTTIIGSAASLLEQHDALDEPGRHALLRSIRDEAQRLHGSMSDLLDLTRMEEGAVRPRCEWCPADDLVQEARDSLGARLERRALRTAVPPEAIVWCDARLVQQALVNLLDNALRHTPASSTIEVRVELAGASWRLVVADDGPGLPEALARDPFKKFAHGRGEAPAAGTGLGLAICAAVARLHDGHIQVSRGPGTRVTLTLPLPSAPAPTAFEEPA